MRPASQTTTNPAVTRLGRDYMRGSKPSFVSLHLILL